MIIGIGIDITETDRLRKAVARYGDRFLEKSFTEKDIASCRNHGDFLMNLAMVFAAKEAVVKAIGTGIRDGINWKDIEVTFNPAGAPQLCFYGKCKTVVHNLHVDKYWISTSSTDRYAVAMVVFEKTGNKRLNENMNFCHPGQS